MKQIYDHSSPDVKKILVGNKCDLVDERKVSTDAGKKLAAQYNMPFLEVSAKNGTNIDEIFQIIGHEIKEKVEQTEKDDQTRTRKRLSVNDTKPVETGGCKC